MKSCDRSLLVDKLLFVDQRSVENKRQRKDAEFSSTLNESFKTHHKANLIQRSEEDYQPMDVEDHDMVPIWAQKEEQTGLLNSAETCLVA